MYFITFSRKTGTNGTEIAQRVADQLGYKIYDTEAIENTAREMGFLEDIREVDEKVPSLFQRFFSQKPEVHLDRLNSVIYELASKGNAVFLGRGSHILLRTFECALHVRVTASIEHRIQNLLKRGLSRDGAMKTIHKSDHERGAFIRLFFGVDWDNPELYDLVVNMDHLTVGLAVETILHVARSEEIRARSMDAMKSLEMMGLARRAEAALIEGGFSHGPSVSVLEPGQVRLTGVVSAQMNKARVEEILKKVRGVQSIDDQIQVVTISGYG
jgi:cytidylate kinase